MRRDEENENKETTLIASKTTRGSLHQNMVTSTAMRVLFGESGKAQHV